MSMFGDILNLVSTGVGLFESIDNNNAMEDAIRRGTDVSDIRAAQLASGKSLFDLLYGNNPAMQADLQQLDQNFLQPNVDRFEDPYNLAVTRYSQGDAYTPGSLRALLASRAREGIDDAYRAVTDATTMQALRTGTNAAETLKELVKQRARDTSSAMRDAELASITGSEQLNLARQESAQKGLATTQSPLLEALKLRGGAASNMFMGNAQTRDTAARGMFNNIGSAYGSEAAARAGGVRGAYENMQEQPWGTAINLGGQALDRLINRPNTVPVGTNYNTGNSGQLMW